MPNAPLSEKWEGKKRLQKILLMKKSGNQELFSHTRRYRRICISNFVYRWAHRLEEDCSSIILLCYTHSVIGMCPFFVCIVLQSTLFYILDPCIIEISIKSFVNNYMLNKLLFITIPHFILARVSCVLKINR